MKPILDIRIQFPPSGLQLKEMGKFFVSEMESHNKSLHWIFTPLRCVKTSEFRRYVTHDSEILSVLIFLSYPTKFACLNIFPGLIFLRFGYIRIYCIQIFLDTQVCLSYTYSTN